MKRLLFLSLAVGLVGCGSELPPPGDMTTPPPTSPGVDGGVTTPPTTPGAPTTPAGNCQVQVAAGTCAAPTTVGGCSDAMVTIDNSALANVVDPTGCATGAVGRADHIIAYTAPIAGLVTAEVISFTQAGQTTSADSVLIASSSCGAPSELACDDDGGEGTLSRVEIPNVQAGQTIYFAAQGYGEMHLGTFNLRITVGDAAPTNPSVPSTGGMCLASGAVDVAGPMHTVNLQGNGPENIRVPSECSSACSGNMAGDAVLRYTPAATGMLEISTDNDGTTETLDTVLAVFSGCDGMGSATLGCDDDSGGTETDGAGPPHAGGATIRSLTSKVTVPVTAGTPIFVGVDLCRAGTEMMPVAGTAVVSFTMQ